MTHLFSMKVAEISLPGLAHRIMIYLFGNVPILSQAPTNSVLKPEKKVKIIRRY